MTISHRRVVVGFKTIHRSAVGSAVDPVVDFERLGHQSSEVFASLLFSSGNHRFSLGNHRFSSVSLRFLDVALFRIDGKRLLHSLRGSLSYTI